MNRNFIKKIIRQYLNENKEDIFNPSYYLDDFYDMDFMEEMYDESTALEMIQKVIDYVKNLQFPIKVYRGINTIQPKNDFENASWSTDVRVAEGFGNKIYVGLIENPDAIDMEQTIRTIVMNPGEKELYVPDFHDVKIIEVYDKREKLKKF